MASRAETLEIPQPHVLREYALLADGERGIVVGPQGEFAFMCFPSWSDDAVFSALIGGDGCYLITPVGRFVWGGSYEPGTLVWRSRWVTEAGIVECREALAMPAGTRRAVILRRVSAQNARARVRVIVNPRPAFGGVGFRSLRRSENGAWRGQTHGLQLALAGAANADAVPDGHGGRALVMELDVDPGRHHDLVLVLACDGDDDSLPDSDDAWQATTSAWRERVPELEHSVAARDARHACAVLTGLTSASGGMVAAATTSLPERAEAGRNYDYRYVWIRDQCYVGQAAARAGADALLDQAVRFTRERLLDDGPRLRPMYSATGGAVPGERRLELAGYPGGTDIIGNKARTQFQLDAFGEALLLLAAAAEVDRLQADDWRAVEAAVDAIRNHWREPDAGVWELEPAAWTHSRLICAAGLRAISVVRPEAHRASDWQALADTIVADTARNSLHPSGRWQRAPGDERPDASLPLASIRGAVHADDPRTKKTLDAVHADLTQDGYAYRFRPDPRPLGDAEGAFLLCGFWLALAFAQQGESVRAMRWFERNRAACGPPALFTEEFDVRQRQLRGNLPQAFVHGLLLEGSAVLTDAADDRSGP